MRYIYTTSRALLLLLHFIFGLIQSSWHQIKYGSDWYRQQKGTDAIRKWMQQSCTILGIQIELSGKPATGPVLLIANHISWLDIVGLSASFPVIFVSKSDIANWPVIGRLAKSSGTIFIKRGKATTLHSVLMQLAKTLANGHKIVIFPEGTTTDGKDIKKFHSGLFEAARLSNAPIQAVSLRYYRNNSRDKIAPYIDDDNFIFHLFKIISAGKTSLRIDFLNILESTALSRQEIAKRCHEEIQRFQASA